MPRPAVTAVVCASDYWQITRACLDWLRPALGPRDRVVVVDNAADAATRAGLRTLPWATVVGGGAGRRRFAAALNQGAAAVGGEVLLFLDADTLLPPGGVDGLVAPLAGEAVAAVGPRSNTGPGEQEVQVVDYSVARLAELRAFARAWRGGHRGQVTPVERLGGFCLAVRRAAFEQVGGFDETVPTDRYDADLCARLVAAGWTLALAHEVFVHCDGVGLRRDDDDAPLLTAAMIVRDEEQTLPGLLASVAGVVDEVVVYDTGSVDGTVRVAREAGARVVEGYWDDDFARARNAALAACRGRWILSVDADDLVEADSRRLREQLAHPGTRDALLVDVVNDQGDDGATRIVHPSYRLFRRRRAHFVGRLHEQVEALPGQPSLSYGKSELLEVTHTGYRPEMVAAKGKQARNVRVAEAALAAGDGDEDQLLLNLARSLSFAGRHEEAVPWYERAATATTRPAMTRMALRSGAESLITVGRPAEALDWLDRLQQHSQRREVGRFLRGIALFNLGEHHAAADCLAGIQELVDDDGLTFSAQMLRSRRGLTLLAAGRWADAADELLELVSSSEVTEPVWVPLLEAAWRAGRQLAPVAAAVPERHLTVILAQALFGRAEAADGLAELLWARFPGDPRVVAFVFRFAPRLPLDRALEWSGAIRAAGLPGSCPLLATATHPLVDPAVRVRAAAVAVATFDDPAGADALAAAAGAVEEAALGELLVALDELAPAALPAFVAGAASTPSRCLALARLLHELGAAEQAVAVLEHGLGLDGVDPDLAEQAGRWLQQIGAPNPSAGRGGGR